jgi:glycerate kinase
MARQTRTSAHTIAGAGAAGGLGFGLMTFLGAKPVTGFSLFAREAGLARRIRAADCVITGEGCLDPQSLMGKGVGELLRLCQRNRVPCIAIGGRVELSLPLQRRFTAVYPLTSGSRLQNPPFRPGFFLSQAAARAARQLGAGRPSHRSGAPDTS